MKLTAIEIAGFKSFADKTKLRFDKGITGIVGPNGCGKSNVIDAIRWVLGEQKTRNLRSDKMEDIIFNGTDKRKRANVADVSISFENTKNILPVEYPSVTITRRLYRDGESEYYLNNVPCRLKDINALLLDTGIGSDSYSIIELGMVEALLKDKNGSRRQLFEEAAGISRYKLRKKETLDRLNDTDTSLTRLEDVLFEIEKNLKSLEKQAKRAEQFLILKEEYKKFSSQTAFLKAAEIDTALLSARNVENNLQEQIAAALAQIAKHEARISERKLELTDAEQRLTLFQKDFNDTTETIRKHESDRKVRAEKVKFLEKRNDDIRKQIEAGKERIAELESRLGSLESLIDNENEAYDKQEFLLNELENEQTELTQAVKNRKLSSEELNQNLKSKEKALQSALRELENRQIEVRSLQNELQRYEKDRENRQTEINRFTEEKSPLLAETERIQNRIAELERHKVDTETRIRTCTEGITALTETHNTVRRAFEVKQNEYKILKNLTDSLEGYPESVVWVKKNLPEMKDAPLVSDLIACEAEYKVAVENYLESYMNYYVVPSRKEARTAVQKLAAAGKGRVQFLLADELEPYASGLSEIPPLPADLISEAVPVLDLVSCPAGYETLLKILFSGVYLWKGSELPATDLPAGLTLLQASGGYISKKFSFGGGSVGVFEGKKLGRAQNLARLGKEADELKAQIETAESSLKEQREVLERLRMSLPTLELDKLRKELIQKNKEQTALEAREEEYRRSLSRITGRAEELQTKINRLETECNRFRPQVETLQAEEQDLREKFTKEEKEYRSRSEKLTALTDRVNKENLRFVEIKNNISNLKKDFRSFLEQIQNIRLTEENFLSEANQNELDLQILRTSDDSDGDAVLALYEKRKEQEQILNRAGEHVQSVKHAVSRDEEAIRTERKKRDELQNEKNDLFQKTTELRLQLNALKDRLSVEWGLELQNLTQEELFPDGNPANFGETEKKMLALREKYNKFGEVNTAAVESYQEVKKRYDFMLAQKQDLVTAKENLLATIAEIDGTAKELFMGAYNQIREHFIRVFRTLFTEDDTCDIVLVRPDDPLESPIDIIAKPKGKRPQTISALSGGEKTLTAISLLFAIYLLKPAPFCIFDEVDAPLDDANIDKFNNIIEEFSKDSQFIIVTHNKRTMVRTQILYGVTMEEKGISRVLPVDLVNLNLA